MQTHYLHIQGQVQGVGFRPYVYQLATGLGLLGWVANDARGLRVCCSGGDREWQDFKTAVLQSPPPNAHITSWSSEEVAFIRFRDFRILASSEGQEPSVLLSPDFGLCEACNRELFDAADRRNNYAFITCTACGPRLSIQQGIPYDRHLTTMQRYSMCAACLAEYEDPHNRRFFSQTNSCPDCGVKMSLVEGDRVYQGNIIDEAVVLLRAGKILAVKGLGGYLLLCDAKQEAVIWALRQRKQRPDKPLALLYPNQEAAAEDAYIDKVAADALSSPVFPIVLCPINPNTSLPVAAIAPGLKQLGLMLPGNPLLSLLSNQFGSPLIATSGNTSGAPIWFEEATATKEGAAIADAFLHNDRPIVMPQDDSVIGFSPFSRQKIILRRSRGLAPTFWQKSKDTVWPALLAMGADRKSTFAIAQHGNIYLSQYLGDLGSFQAERAYRNTCEHYQEILGFKADLVLHDQHPEYTSRRMAQEFEDVKKMAIQHHIAHFSALLLEHDLIKTSTPVMGFIWDGLGIGEDGNIWGGECFRYLEGSFLRAYYFDYFDYFLGDKMSLEPRLSALAICKNLLGATPYLQHKFSSIEWTNYNKLLVNYSGPKTSSLGRIFDGVASLLGLGDKITYEGQAAMLLEQLATTYLEEFGLDFQDSYVPAGAAYYRIPTQSIVQYLLIDLAKGKAPAYIAAKFHRTLVSIIQNVANNTHCEQLAFSGGVFQNGLLVDMIRHHLQGTFQLYFHEQLSPNDENISLGQLAYFQIQQQFKLSDYVLSNSGQNKVY